MGGWEREGNFLNRAQKNSQGWAGWAQRKAVLQASCALGREEMQKKDKAHGGEAEGLDPRV